MDELFVYIFKMVIFLIVLAITVVGIYIFLQGDAKFVFKVQERSCAMRTKMLKERLDFEVEVPCANIGKQDGIILDAYMRIYLPQEQYSYVLVRGKINLKDALREDDYFEAVKVPRGTEKNMLLRFEVYSENGKNIEEAVKNIPDVDVALFVDCIARGKVHTVKQYMTLTAEELRVLA